MTVFEGDGAPRTYTGEEEIILTSLGGFSFAAKQLFE